MSVTDAEAQMSNDNRLEVREILARLQEDARAMPLCVRADDRAAAVAHVRALLFAPPSRDAHYALAREVVPDAPVPREPFPEDRAVAIIDAGLDSLTNEELAHLLLVRRPMDQLSRLVTRRAPAWSDAEFVALGAALAEKYNWTAPAGW